MITPRQPSPREGFTLVEVVLAATVMLAGIVGMMHVITSGSEMLDAARKQTIATQIMHGEIERIRVSDWTQIKALASSHPSPTIKNGYAEASAGRVVKWLSVGDPVPENSFRFSRTITPLPGRIDEMKQVVYNVTWVGNTGHTYTRSTSTFVGKNGLYVSYQR